MNTLIKIFGIFAVISLLVSGCGMYSTKAEQEEPARPNVVAYELVLGKALTNEDVADFIASNNCSSLGQFQQCKEMGMALWINPAQIVQTVYLYLNKAEGLAPYKGALPFGLKFYDTMGAVEYKLKRQGVGNDGLPDSGNTPDHLHYWANYQQARMTIVYNTFSPEDEDATIYAILVSQ